ncbi:MAG: hypothetical protein H6741_15185 [Alphaproteobacteria bacterium]|nr:hypothetical protein [Alphaproteobacteria bacterium]
MSFASPSPARVHVPVARRVALRPRPSAPPPTLFLTEPSPLEAPPAPSLVDWARSSASDPEGVGGATPSLKLAAALALGGRFLGGAACGVSLGLLAAIGAVEVEALEIALPLALLAWPLVSLLTAFARVAALHEALSWCGLASRPRRESLAVGVAASASPGGLAWLPGVGVAICLLWECRALARLHGQPLAQVVLAAACTLVLPLCSAVLSGVFAAMLLA